jgi:Domain of unknown function (DUF4365)
MPSPGFDSAQYSTIQQEEFSYAFLGAIVSAAGYTINPATRSQDNTGIDITVMAPGRIGGRIGKKRSPMFTAQVKSTSDDSCIKKTRIHYPLKVHNYKDLISTEVYVPYLLIVVFVPKEISDWVRTDEEKTIIQKSAYWVSLKGKEDTTNTENITIQIPRTHLLTPQSLKGVMQSIVDNTL